MTALPTQSAPRIELEHAPRGDADPTDLADLIASFNQVTARLEQTHLNLRDEVVRLKAELGKANQELERSRRLAALGEMAAGIAHEVRNPLGSIGLNARMLAQDLADHPDQKHLAEQIGSAVKGLDAIVNDVLTFGRDLSLRLETVFPEEMVDEAIARCKHLLVAKGAPKVIRRTPGPLPPVQADGKLLVQALVNVIRNGIEASHGRYPNGGGIVALDVRTSADFAGSQDSMPMVEFHVEDNGDGINSETLERMFNPFFTTRAAGTGLGLPIVHRIIDAHAGHIEVEQAVESGGTRFVLRVPINRSDDERSDG